MGTRPEAGRHGLPCAPKWRDQPPRRDRQGRTADLPILIDELAAKLPIVREHLKPLVFLNGERPVLDRMANIGCGHIRRRDQRAGWLIPTHPAKEAGLSAASEIAFSESLFLKLLGKMLPILARAEQPIEAEPILRKIDVIATERLDAFDGLSEGLPLRQAEGSVLAVRRVQMRKLRAVAGADQNDALANLRNTEIGGVVEVEGNPIPPSAQRLDDVQKRPARLLLEAGRPTPRRARRGADAPAEPRAGRGHSR